MVQVVGCGQKYNIQLDTCIDVSSAKHPSYKILLTEKIQFLSQALQKLLFSWSFTIDLVYGRTGFDNMLRNGSCVGTLTLFSSTQLGKGELPMEFGLLVNAFEFELFEFRFSWSEINRGVPGAARLGHNPVAAVR